MAYFFNIYCNMENMTLSFILFFKNQMLSNTDMYMYTIVTIIFKGFIFLQDFILEKNWLTVIEI